MKNVLYDINSIDQEYKQVNDFLDTISLELKRCLTFEDLESVWKKISTEIRKLHIFWVICHHYYLISQYKKDLLEAINLNCIVRIYYALSNIYLDYETYSDEEHFVVLWKEINVMITIIKKINNNIKLLILEYLQHEINYILGIDIKWFQNWEIKNILENSILWYIIQKEISRGITKKNNFQIYNNYLNIDRYMSFDDFVCRVEENLGWYSWEFWDIRKLVHWLFRELKRKVKIKE